MSAMPGQVRVISGLWRRSKIPVSAAHSRNSGLRPTPDRVRETLFNWLGQDLGGWRCVDVFAGSGALGLEAASRGATQVHFWEMESELVRNLIRLYGQLQERAPSPAEVKIQRGDGVSALARTRTSSTDWDLIFLDPPFDAGADLFQRALRAARSALSADGFIYLEAPKRWSDEHLAELELGLVVHRHLKAGAVHAHLLRSGQRKDASLV